MNGARLAGCGGCACRLSVCREEVESEPSFGAGRLLLLHKRFTEEPRSLEASFDTMKALKDVFGNTVSSRLYRFVEAAGDHPIVGMLTGHPHVSRRSEDLNPSALCRHFSRSPACERCVGRVSEAKPFSAVADYCGAQGGGALGGRRGSSVRRRWRLAPLSLRDAFRRIRRADAGSTSSSGEAWSWRCPDGWRSSLDCGAGRPRGVSVNPVRIALAGFCAAVET